MKLDQQIVFLLEVLEMFVKKNLKRIILDHLNINSIRSKFESEANSAEYEHFIIMGDFNTEVTQMSMMVSCHSYEFKNLIKDATCYKNLENPSCIDLILTNNSNSFQNSGVIETGLSDFHKMTVTVMKTTFEKLKPNIIHYRDYRKFSNDKFRENLISRLSTENIRVDCNGMEKFLQICIKTLDELAPQKKKYSRGNNMPFINETIKKSLYGENPFEKYISKKPFR